MPRWATFDCYGTLIDWDGGIRRTLSGLWPAEDGDALLAGYHAAEPEVQREQPGLSYREVMTQSTRRIAEARGLELGDASAVTTSLPSWEPFPEVPVHMRERSSGESKLQGKKALVLVVTVIGTLLTAEILRRRRAR